MSLPRKRYGLAVLIFGWTGWCKGEPSDLPCRPEQPLLNSRPAAAFLLFVPERTGGLKPPAAQEIERLSAPGTTHDKIRFETPSNGDVANLLMTC